MPLTKLDLHRLCAREDELGGFLARIGKVLDGRLRVEGVHDLGHDLRQPNNLREEYPASAVFFLLVFRFFMSCVVPVAPLIKVVFGDRFDGPIGVEDMGWSAMD